MNERRRSLRGGREGVARRLSTGNLNDLGVQLDALLQKDKKQTPKPGAKDDTAHKKRVVRLVFSELRFKFKSLLCKCLADPRPTCLSTKVYHRGGSSVVSLFAIETRAS